MAIEGELVMNHVEDEVIIEMGKLMIIIPIQWEIIAVSRKHQWI